MLVNIKELKEAKYDFLTFLEGDKAGTVHIMGSDYNEPGEKVGGSALGDSYHIILFRDHKTDKDKYDGNVDCFDAVLCEPLEYVSSLIPQGWFGIIARKTTTSRPLIDRMLDKFKETM